MKKIWIGGQYPDHKLTDLGKASLLFSFCGCAMKKQTKPKQSKFIFCPSTVFVRQRSGKVCEVLLLFCFHTVNCQCECQFVRGQWWQQRALPVPVRAPDGTWESLSPPHCLPPHIMVDSWALSFSNTHRWGQGANRSRGCNCRSHSSALSDIFLLTPPCSCQPEACFSVHRLLSLSVKGWERSKSLSMVLQRKHRISNMYSFTMA